MFSLAQSTVYQYGRWISSESLLSFALRIAEHLQVVIGALKLSDKENPVFLVDKIVQHRYDE